MARRYSAISGQSCTYQALPSHGMVGRDYLQSYVNEYTFRYNHRRDEQPMFQTIAQRVRAVRDGQYGEYAPVGR